MTVQSRGARSRRGGRFNSGRGPGGLLLTALLVLAILASSTLVFTSRVELLRLAVILSLWAAVLAAFVTVIYRRQSDVAQSRARDMKFVYDLQLDREISARREYELSVEARLRRQMSRESGQAAEEMAALRAELASLRSQLEVMLGTDLASRPALESDRVAVPMPAAPDRVESSRVTVVAEEVVVAVEETAIIDVAEEPLAPTVDEPAFAPATNPPAPPPPPAPPAERYAAPPAPPAPPQPDAPWRPPESRPGRHGVHYAPRPDAPRPDAPRPEPAAPPSPPPAPPRGRHWVPDDTSPVPAGRHRGQQEPIVEEAATPQAPEGAESNATQGQHADGQSFAELMQRLNADRPVQGGGRRRRQD